MRTWFPEASCDEHKGRFRPAFRFYVEEGFRPVPGSIRYPTFDEAKEAARDFLIAAQKPIRAERQESANDDPLGISAWREQRAGRAAQDQEQALGAVIVRGRQIPVERRRA